MSAWATPPILLFACLLVQDLFQPSSIAKQASWKIIFPKLPCSWHSACYSVATHQVFLCRTLSELSHFERKALTSDFHDLEWTYTKQAKQDAGHIFSCTEAGQVGEFCADNYGYSCLSSNFMAPSRGSRSFGSLVLHSGSGSSSARACFFRLFNETLSSLFTPLNKYSPDSTSHSGF